MLHMSLKAKKDTLIDRSRIADRMRCKALKKEIEEMKKAEISKGSGKPAWKKQRM